jgi:hypothetical protein
MNPVQPRIIRAEIGEDLAAYFVGHLACQFFGFLDKSFNDNRYSAWDTGYFKMPGTVCLDRERDSREGWQQEGMSSIETQGWAHNFRDWEFKTNVMIFSGTTFMDRGLATGVSRKVRPYAVYLQTADEESFDWLGVNVRVHANCDAREMHLVELDAKQTDILDGNYESVVAAVENLPVISRVIYRETSK